MGFPANGPSHMLTNIGAQDLVYLMGGDRPQYDVCFYPDEQKQLYVYPDAENNRKRDWVDAKDVRLFF